MRISVVVFPGSNCDHDVAHVYGTVLHQEVTLVWHRERDLKNPDLVVLPGGFSYGDYLRTGALAKLSPVMQAVREFADKGGPVLGICNGFQILCEAGLLPGVLLRNQRCKFLSQFVSIKVENNKTPFTSSLSKGSVITCPIAHGEGNFFAAADAVRRLEDEGRVVFRYCTADGTSDPKNSEVNPNGSINGIAGICNQKGNVVGLMPHPERACEALIGEVGVASGKPVFEGSIAAS